MVGAPPGIAVAAVGNTVAAAEAGLGSIAVAVVG